MKTRITWTPVPMCHLTAYNIHLCDFVWLKTSETDESVFAELHLEVEGSSVHFSLTGGSCGRGAGWGKTWTPGCLLSCWLWLGRARRAGRWARTRLRMRKSSLLYPETLGMNWTDHLRGFPSLSLRIQPPVRIIQQSDLVDANMINSLVK